MGGRLRCLCDVEVENLRRERLVADVTLDKPLLQEELRRPGEVCPGAGRGSVFSGWKSVQRETGPLGCSRCPLLMPVLERGPGIVNAAGVST